MLLGELAGAARPGRVYSPLIGVDLALDASAEVVLPLEPDFEHAVLTATGTAVVAGARLDPGALLYLGTGRRELRLRAHAPARLLLLGGEPFAEEIVMWWNFLGSNGEEIAAAREAWAADERFGTVIGYDGDPLPAPPMPETPLRPRGRRR